MLETTCTVGPAYQQLMADFFPPPNLLLLDGSEHHVARRRFEEDMAGLVTQIVPLVRDCVRTHVVAGWKHEAIIDVYKNMKDLSWNILCDSFLGLSPTRNKDEFNSFVSLHEALLRGQFSLFPVSVRTPFWHSARSKGLIARSKLQDFLHSHLDASKTSCPFARGTESDRAEYAGNCLLFTSSIAVKALASLLTASLLNIFLFPHCETSLATQLRSQEPGQRGPFLRSILRETERLSPPVIGVMRRVEDDVILSTSSHNDQTKSLLVPAGWDLWLYFVGACRDTNVYADANRLIPERYLRDNEPKPGFAFGAGKKECLGKEVSRKIVETVMSELLESGYELKGSVDRPGVRCWLGWEDNIPLQEMAKDLKQLPTQRPREPIRLRVCRR